MEKDRLSIAQAALRLGLTYQQVRTKLLSRELEGGEDDGRFYVLVDRPRPGSDEGSEVAP